MKAPFSDKAKRIFSNPENKEKIAKRQENGETLEDLLLRDTDGKVYTVRYASMTPTLKDFIR